MGMLVKHFFRFAYTHFGGLPSYSMAEWYAMIMYSFFLFLNVFIIVGVEGTLFQALVSYLCLSPHWYSFIPSTSSNTNTHFAGPTYR